jgi:hypothetical protein
MTDSHGKLVNTQKVTSLFGCREFSQKLFPVKIFQPLALLLVDIRQLSQFLLLSFILVPRARRCLGPRRRRTPKRSPALVRRQPRSPRCIHRVQSRAISLRLLELACQRKSGPGWEPLRYFAAELVSLGGCARGASSSS